MRVWLWVLLMGCDAVAAKKPASNAADRPSDPPLFQGSTCEQALALFGTRCVACHKPEGQAPALDPTGVASLNATQLALLQRKVTGTQAPDEGLRMPPGVVLPQAELAIVAAWIEEGAPVECKAPSVEPVRHHVGLRCVAGFDVLAVHDAGRTLHDPS